MGSNPAGDTRTREISSCATISALPLIAWNLLSLFVKSLWNKIWHKVADIRVVRCYAVVLPYFKPYTFRAILAASLCIPIGGLDAVIAMSLKPYTDQVMVEKSAQAAWYIPFAIVLFAVTQGVLNYFAAYLNTWVGEKVGRDLKFKLCKKLLSYDTAYFDGTQSGTIIMKFSSLADAATGGFLGKLKMLVSRMFSTISLVGALIYNSWQLSIVAIIALGLAFLPVTRLRKDIRSATEKSIGGNAKLTTVYNETCSGNKTITAYNLKQRQETKFLTLMNSLVRIRIKLTQKTAWLSPAMHAIVSVGLGISIAYGSHLIVSGQITSGNFVSFLTALFMLYNPVKSMGNNIKDFQLSITAIESVIEILKSTSKITDRANAITIDDFKTDICFDNVSFEYKPGVPVLKNINLHIRKGETLALVGNSGGGKSTIANLLPRFYDVTSGAVKIDGLDIRDYTLESLRNCISVVFQDNFLFSGTIRENVMLGNEHATSEDVERALDLACLGDFVKTLEKGMDTEIGERGILLSGGQKQRVAIARAFIKDAPIIILDEATSALDNKSEAVVQRAIDNLMENKTVLVIAHRLSTIKNASRIAVINNGELAELGTHEELMAIENGQYRTLYEMQFKKS